MRKQIIIVNVLICAIVAAVSFYQNDLAEEQAWFYPVAVAICMCVLLVYNMWWFYMLSRKQQRQAMEVHASDQAQADFLSAMSHDIRTPMNAVVGMTEIALKNVDDGEVVEDCLKKINIASQHLMTLVNDILDISKVESGQLVLNPQAFSIADSAENLVNIIRPQIREKNQKLLIHSSDMIYEYLYADQLRMNQIWINILSNAIKYTPPGGTISIMLRQELIEKQEGMVRLIYEVSDTGKGMSPEFMQRMYAPFSREESSENHDGPQGTGLGLSITKRMVDVMGGTITCDSKVGKGTTFTVTLDLPVADKSLEKLRLPSIRMLLVDDDNLTLTTTQSKLRKMGVNADICTSSAQALVRAGEKRQSGEPYELVMIDCGMQEMNGLELARALRREHGQSLKLIFVSSYDWTEVAARSHEIDIDGFISKPLFRSNLYEGICWAMNLEQTQEIHIRQDMEELKGLHVLVAEDNDLNWEIIADLLAMYGISSDRAEDGQVCIDRMEQAEEGTYDMIFMDVQMPNMNGLEATRRLRASDQEAVRSIPIIAMTADAFAEDVTECMEAGMDDHISKPIDMDFVLRVIRKTLNHEAPCKQVIHEISA
jgi:signal transduction histidine kinase/CheY-like chemotaxis protein